MTFLTCSAWIGNKFRQLEQKNIAILDCQAGARLLALIPTARCIIAWTLTKNPNMVHISLLDNNVWALLGRGGGFLRNYFLPQTWPPEWVISFMTPSHAVALSLHVAACVIPSCPIRGSIESILKEGLMCIIRSVYHPRSIAAKISLLKPAIQRSCLSLSLSISPDLSPSTMA